MLYNQFCSNIIKELESNTKIEGDVAYLIDKIEGFYIDEHYSQTHYSVSLLIYGILKKEINIINKSIMLVKGYLRTYNAASQKKDFHHDFNNFAISIYYFIFKRHFPDDQEIIESLENNILSSKDSTHYTINWLPMRIFNLLTRDSISSNWINKLKVKSLFKLIQFSSYTDYVFDDRVPRGKSFNLQYNISTIASLKLLSDIFNISIDLDPYVNRLIDFIDPNGDINYMGRGTNQIFAWGPWLFLTNHFPKLRENQKVIKSEQNFLSKYMAVTKAENLLINSYNAKDRDYWWDYHYSSVYTSHLLMWTLLSHVNTDNYNNANVIINEVSLSKFSKSNSGIELYQNDDFFCMIFKGRSDYYAERGPSVFNLWTKKYGYIFKGGYGPLPNKFGDRNTGLSNIIFNFIGPVSINYKKDLITFKPSAKNIRFYHRENYIYIEFSVNPNSKSFFNLPIFLKSSINSDDWSLYCDDRLISDFYHTKIKNQYDEMMLHQSANMNGSKWIFKIKI